MPSPFPGMDPYLEDPACFPGLHHFLITGLAARLNSLLPRSYVARIQERLYVDRSDRNIYPDTSVVRRLGSRKKSPKEKSKVAAAVACDPAWEVEHDSDPLREVFVEITSVEDQTKVITTVEILSPSNKTRGSEGRDPYEKKQREVLASATSLVEIDLLRYGEHTVAAPAGRLARRGRFDYLVCLSRGSQHHRFTVWARTVRDRLPRFLVPLAGTDPDVVVDLQLVFDRAYDEGAFERNVNYSGPPRVRLSPADEEWSLRLLRKQGLRR